MLAAHELSMGSYLALPPALHLRLLAAMCNDCLDGALLRHIVQVRVEEGSKLKADRQQWLAQVSNGTKACRCHAGWLWLYGIAQLHVIAWLALVEGTCTYKPAT